MKLHWLTGLLAVACSIPAWASLPLTPFEQAPTQPLPHSADRKSTRLNSSHRL